MSAGCTIHKDHHHHGWDDSNAPALAVAPGDVLEVEAFDAAGGQMTETSTAGACLTAAVLLIFLLGACANIDVDRSAADFDETAYASDLSGCRGGPAALFVISRLEAAVIGSVYGLVQGAHIGAAAGNTDKGAVIGAIVGSVLGLNYGAHRSIHRHDEALARCLREKGYETNPV